MPTKFDGNVASTKLCAFATALRLSICLTARSTLHYCIPDCCSVHASAPISVIATATNLSTDASLHHFSAHHFNLSTDASLQLPTGKELWGISLALPIMILVGSQSLWLKLEFARIPTRTYAIGSMSPGAGSQSPGLKLEFAIIPTWASAIGAASPGADPRSLRLKRGFVTGLLWPGVSGTVIPRPQLKDGSTVQHSSAHHIYCIHHCIPGRGAHHCENVTGNHLFDGRADGDIIFWAMFLPACAPTGSELGPG
eukprot:gene9556-biopygen4869